MKTISSILTLSALAIGLSSCSSPKSQNDCGFVKNVYGQRISWKDQNTIKIYIHSSVPQELRPAIFRAASTWENQIGRKIFEFSEDSTQLSATPSKDKKNAIYFLQDWESDRKTEQGRTSVYWTGDLIQEADIRINAADFSYYDQDTQNVVGSSALKKLGQTAKEAYSFEALVLHEMGHFLGLKHNDPATVMATHLGAYNNRTQLTASDKEAISCEYR